MKNINIFKVGFLVLLVLALSLVSISPVFAQTPSAPVYALGLSRDFGYGGGSQIRGTFSAHVAGPEGIANVAYYIDGQVMSTVTTSPFRYQFNTTSYATGVHNLYAEVTTTNGTVYTTQTLTYDFVTQAQEGETMKNILLPSFAGILGLFLIMVLIQTIAFRKRKGPGIPLGAERNYGMAGGSICPHCHRPTPRHMWGINVGFGKLDYCENCGKWSVMRGMPIDMLRAAEQAEKANAEKETPSQVKEKTGEEKLREMVENSKYDNHDKS